MGRSALLRALQTFRSQQRSFSSTTQALAANAARPGETLPEMLPYAGPSTVIDVSDLGHSCATIRIEIVHHPELDITCAL